MGRTPDLWYDDTVNDLGLTTEKLPQAFTAPLLAWYRANARDLPWRHTRDPYRIWVSEIMLQQTRAETVVSYYERFLSRYPTVFLFLIHL